MPSFHVPHCHMAGCGATCLSPWAATLIVGLVATVILATPILHAAGMDLNAAVVTPFRITFRLALLIAVWFLALILGVTRKHENALWCAVDSAGIPAVAALLLHVPGLGE
jgi:hypothetical protein